jgi:hypothetical protein
MSQTWSLTALGLGQRISRHRVATTRSISTSCSPPRLVEVGGPSFAPEHVKLFAAKAKAQPSGKYYRKMPSLKSQNSNKPTYAGGGGGVGRGGRGGFGHGGGPGGLGTTAALFIRSFASSISKERFHIPIAMQ